MPRRIALKRLTASDLTFFEWQFRNRNAGNQKSINLNRDVFVDEMYPALPTVAAELEGRLPLDLYLLGPGLAGAYNLQRKIVKHGEYKNWRLNGEFIFNPPGDANRFNVLVPGDLLLIEFDGDVKPTNAKALFLARDEPEDADLHRALDTHLGTRKMATVSPAVIEEVIEREGPSEAHPIRVLALDSAIEDAAEGGLRGMQRLARRPAMQRMTRERLLEAREAADRNGRLGESLLNAHFVRQRDDGTIEDFAWVADENAVAPFDFRVDEEPESGFYADAKSTPGDFERPLHISMSELIFMSEADRPYYIYRVYELTDERALCRTSADMREWGAEVINAFEDLPNGVTVDSVSLLPEQVEWGATIELSPLDEDEIPEEE